MHFLKRIIFKWKQMSPWLRLLNAAYRWSAHLILILTSNFFFFFFPLERGQNSHCLMTAMLKKAKSQNSAGSLIFLAVVIFIEVIYFWVGLNCTLTNKFDLISSKNPITLVNEEACAYCCANITSNLLILNISKISYNMWYFETDPDSH